MRLCEGVRNPVRSTWPILSKSETTQEAGCPDADSRASRKWRLGKANRPLLHCFSKRVVFLADPCRQCAGRVPNDGTSCLRSKRKSPWSAHSRCFGDPFRSAGRCLNGVRVLRMRVLDAGCARVSVFLPVEFPYSTSSRSVVMAAAKMGCDRAGSGRAERFGCARLAANHLPLISAAPTAKKIL